MLGILQRRRIRFVWKQLPSQTGREQDARVQLQLEQRFPAAERDDVAQNEHQEIYKRADRNGWKGELCNIGYKEDCGESSGITRNDEENGSRLYVKCVTSINKYCWIIMQ